MAIVSRLKEKVKSILPSKKEEKKTFTPPQPSNFTPAQNYTPAPNTSTEKGPVHTPAPSNSKQPSQATPISSQRPSGGSSKGGSSRQQISTPSEANVSLVSGESAYVAPPQQTAPNRQAEAKTNRPVTVQTSQGEMAIEYSRGQSDLRPFAPGQVQRTNVGENLAPLRDRRQNLERKGQSIILTKEELERTNYANDRTLVITPLPTQTRTVELPEETIGTVRREISPNEARLTFSFDLTKRDVSDIISQRKEELQEQGFEVADLGNTLVATKKQKEGYVFTDTGVFEDPLKITPTRTFATDVVYEVEKNPFVVQKVDEILSDRSARKRGAVATETLVQQGLTGPIVQGALVIEKGFFDIIGNKKKSQEIAESLELRKRKSIEKVVVQQYDIDTEEKLGFAKSAYETGKDNAVTDAILLYGGSKVVGEGVKAVGKHAIKKGIISEKTGKVIATTAAVGLSIEYGREQGVATAKEKLAGETTGKIIENRLEDTAEAGVAGYGFAKGAGLLNNPTTKAPKPRKSRFGIKQFESTNAKVESFPGEKELFVQSARAQGGEAQLTFQGAKVATAETGLPKGVTEIDVVPLQNQPVRVRQDIVELALPTESVVVTNQQAKTTLPKTVVESFFKEPQVDEFGRLYTESDVLPGVRAIVEKNPKNARKLRKKDVELQGRTIDELVSTEPLELSQTGRLESVNILRSQEVFKPAPTPPRTPKGEKFKFQKGKPTGRTGRLYEETSVKAAEEPTMSEPFEPSPSPEGTNVGLITEPSPIQSPDTSIGFEVPAIVPTQRTPAMGSLYPVNPTITGGPNNLPIKEDVTRKVDAAGRLPSLAELRKSAQNVDQVPTQEASFSNVFDQGSTQDIITGEDQAFVPDQSFDQSFQPLQEQRIGYDFVDPPVTDKLGFLGGAPIPGDLGGGGGRRRKGKRPKKAVKSRYTPSTTAILFNIKGKKGKRSRNKIFSDVEIRPVY